LAYSIPGTSDVEKLIDGHTFKNLHRDVKRIVHKDIKDFEKFTVGMLKQILVDIPDDEEGNELLKKLYQELKQAHETFYGEVVDLKVLELDIKKFRREIEEEDKVPRRFRHLFAFNEDKTLVFPVVSANVYATIAKDPQIERIDKWLISKSSTSLLKNLQKEAAKIAKRKSEPVNERHLHIDGKFFRQIKRKAAQTAILHDVDKMELHCALLPLSDDNVPKEDPYALTEIKNLATSTSQFAKLADSEYLYKLYGVKINDGASREEPVVQLQDFGEKVRSYHKQLEEKMDKSTKKSSTADATGKKPANEGSGKKKDTNEDGNQAGRDGDQDDKDEKEPKKERNDEKLFYDRLQQVHNTGTITFGRLANLLPLDFQQELNEAFDVAQFVFNGNTNMMLAILNLIVRRVMYNQQVSPNKG
jgi:hypothetical protein